MCRSVRHLTWSNALMVPRKAKTVINQSSAQVRQTPRSLLLVSSGVVRKCEHEKESIMGKLKKRIVRWGLSTAKVSLAAALFALPTLPVLADDEDSHDFGARVEQRLNKSSRHWFGIQGPLELLLQQRPGHIARRHSPRRTRCSWPRG